MRVICRALTCLIVVFGVFSGGGKRASAGPPQELMPAESAAKARQLLQQVIAALGGQAYLGVRDSDCQGRIAQFGPVGDLPDFTDFRDLWLYPDKNRREYSIKSDQTVAAFLLGSEGLWFAPGGTTVTVFNGSEGWLLGKKGVELEPDDVVKNFDDGLKTSMDSMLRARLNDPGIEARYVGPDIIDLKEADWIEFSDSEHRDLRLGIEKSTHLPLRWVIATRDPETKRTSDVTTSYIQYMVQDGVRTPLNVEQYRNGIRTTQTYFSSCKYNTDLAPQLFTRAALEERAAEQSKKGHKDSKNKK